MNNAYEQRKHTSFSPYSRSRSSQSENLYETYDWVGTLKLFSLYAQMFLFFVAPIIYQLNSYSFAEFLSLVSFYFVGSLLGKLICLASPISSPEAIKKNLIQTEMVILLCFLAFSMALFLSPHSLFLSFLWGILGLSSAYHDYLEKNFIKRVLQFIPQKVKHLNLSQEVMLQSLIYFLILFFLMIATPFLIGSLLSFFYYTRDNFSIFIPLTFGNLILIFTLIYHVSMLQSIVSKTNEDSPTEGTEEAREKTISWGDQLKRILKYLHYGWKRTEITAFLANFASIAPLVGLSYFFLSSQMEGTYLLPLINLAIISSVCVISTTITFFYLTSFSRRVKLESISKISLFVFSLSLLLYIYILFSHSSDRYLIPSVFIALRTSYDSFWITRLYIKRKRKSFEITANTLVATFKQISIPVLIASLLLFSLYPFIQEIGLYIVSLFFMILAIFSSFLEKK